MRDDTSPKGVTIFAFNAAYYDQVYMLNSILVGDANAKFANSEGILKLKSSAPTKIGNVQIFEKLVSIGPSRHLKEGPTSTISKFYEVTVSGYNYEYPNRKVVSSVECSSFHASLTMDSNQAWYQQELCRIYSISLVDQENET